MLHSYLELPDGTLVAHSNVCEDNTVEVRFERPVEGGFDTALCTLPSFRWSEQSGFSDAELADLDDLIRHNAPSSCATHARRRRSMPEVFSFRGYTFYFCAAGYGEPVHIHVAEG